MNYYIIRDYTNPVPWVNDFKHHYAIELQGLGHVVSYIDYDDVSKLLSSDFLLISHFKELLKVRSIDTNAIKIMQSNGTSVNPWIYQLNRQQEYADLESIDINITVHDIHTEKLRAEFGIKNVHTVGYPISIPDNIIRRKKNPGTFVIAGRLTPDKNVYLALYSIIQYCKYEKIYVCYQSYTKDELLKYSNELSAHRVEFIQCDKNRYLQILADSEFYVNFSLGDTSSFTTVEALLLDCYPLLCDFKLDIPYYQRYVDVTIPIDRLNMMKEISIEKPTFKADIGQFNPKFCATKLTEICESYVI